jgi:superfamily I DNA/RNA helicase
MTPTTEQLNIINKAVNGDNLIIQAFAGAAKTTTLHMIAEAIPNKNILYLAYNKAIVTDAVSKMPSNVTCKTIHSVAYTNSDSSLISRLRGPKLEIKWLVPFLKIKSINAYSDKLQKSATVNSYRVMSWVNRTLARYMNSSDVDLQFHHVYIDADYSLYTFSNSDKQQILNYAKTLWNYYLNSQCTITHDFYLKMFSLSNKNVNYDVIMVDECQDVNGSMVNILKSQTTSQLIYVGDKFQKIYSFTGTIDITKHSTAETLYLTKSFRFGKGIADIANTWLQKIEPGCGTLIGTDATTTFKTKGNPDVIICRTNANVIKKYIEYTAKDKLLNINISCDVEPLLKFAQALYDLEKTNKTEHMLLKHFTHVDTFYKFIEVNGDLFDADIVRIARLCKDIGAFAIVKAFSKYGECVKPDILITTAHKAKGLEWDIVELADDFNTGEIKAKGTEVNLPSVPKYNKEELRLFYVALTRAKKCLLGYEQYKD